MLFCFVLVIYILGDIKVFCGNIVYFEVEILMEYDVYMLFYWDRVDELVSKKINIEYKKYKGSDIRNFIINNVCINDEGGY